MAIEHNEQHQHLLDALYCKEDRWGQVLDNEKVAALPLLEQDLLWEDGELLSLFSKEQETYWSFDIIKADPFLCLARKEAVKWILKVISHYGFSTLTAIFAVNYLDRFLSSFDFQRDKPWMTQLAAVTCLSLAAKVEETQVPLLLDFQVEDAKYVFEAKTIERMEILVLSSLKWRMNPVTPLSFLHHIIRNNHLHLKFLRQCESLLLMVMPECRFLCYMPSVLAAATMLHVVHQVEHCNAVDCQNQLLDVLKISQEEVNDCYKLITEVSSNSTSHKRKYESPNTAVIDSIYTSESSNDSWDSFNSAHHHVFPLFKKSRVQQQQMRLTSLSKVFVDTPH